MDDFFVFRRGNTNKITEIFPPTLLMGSHTPGANGTPVDIFSLASLKIYCNRKNRPDGRFFISHFFISQMNNPFPNDLDYMSRS